MLIPFVVKKKLCVFHGPYPDARTHPTKVQKYFPYLTPATPRAFKKGHLDLKFMDPDARVFRSMPTLGNKYYLAWLKTVQAKCKA